MKKIYYLLVIPILMICCSCNDDEEQLATVRTNDAVVTASDPVNKEADMLIGGVVINDGGIGVSERGILFGQTPNPSTKTAIGDGVGEFTTTIHVNTKETYYYRAYAVSGKGTVYGDLKIINPVPEKSMFPQDFDGGVFPPANWTILDHDGDGQNWYYSSSGGLSVAASRSYLSPIGPLNPYNFLVTPKILITASNPVVRWKVRSGYYPDVAERYKVVISEVEITNENCEDPAIVKTIFEETLTKAEYDDWGVRNEDISSYIGKEVYVAWVHYKCTNQSRMYVTNISVNLGDDAGGGIVAPSIPGYYRTGSPKDKEVETVNAGLVLAGGGTDNNAAMKWFLQQANGGDVVVIRASGLNGYNPYFYSKLGVSVNSVTTMVLDEKEKANMDEVANIIKSAEALFIAGGDQWDYVNLWKGTKTADAIDYLINTKKVVVGGTSAGMAVLGEVVFTAENGTPTSDEALANPYHTKVTLDKDVFAVPAIVRSVVTDSHYSNRSRHGRHVAFMARMVKNWSMNAKGIGCDENTAVCINAAGIATVYGPCAYFIQQNGSAAPETCTSGQRLTWNNSGKALKVYKLPGNDSGSSTFNLNDWTTAAGGTWQWWSVSSGVLTETNM